MRGNKSVMLGVFVYLFLIEEVDEEKEQRSVGN